MNDLAFAQNRCLRIHSEVNRDSTLTSFNEVRQIIAVGPYAKLPTIPIQIWETIGRRLSFFVGRRSTEIINENPLEVRDYREVGQNKPIHPMGIGLVGRIKFFPSPWSGVFRGAEFPVIARASISQGQPLKVDAKGDQQKRSTAMALKIFPSLDPSVPVKTLNAVFQNDLNGIKRADGKALDFLESPQTNHPSLDFSKISESYEWLTLVGVALGSFRTPTDRMARVPFINPQIRPVHSLAEWNVRDARDVKLPTWIQIRPRRSQNPVDASDFRVEIEQTLKQDGQIIYDLYAGNERDSLGRVQWRKVGELTFDHSVLSAAIDQNLIFPHDRLNSDVTGEPMTIPDPSQQHNSVPDDIQ